MPTKDQTDSGIFDNFLEVLAISGVGQYATHWPVRKIVFAHVCPLV